MCMTKNEERPFRIVCAGDPSIKAHRYRLSGVFRYASEHPDLAIVCVNFAIRHLNGKVLSEIRTRIAANHPDALICSPEVAFDSGRLAAPLPDIPIACTQMADLPTSLAIPSDVLGILDDEALCRAAVDLALKRGEANFAYVDTMIPTERFRSDLRFEAFRKLLAAHGQQLTRCPIARSRDDFENLRRLSEWLAALPKHCTVFAYADNRAHTVIDACHLAHLKIPDQISVIGIDNDTEICEILQPTLTSVYPDFELGGYLAAQELHRILRSGRRRKKPIVFRYGVKAVVERGSTQDLRGGGRLVSLAQQIIADSFTDATLSASVIARRLHASRQLLDLRFREILGHTVHAEIERLRIVEAERLLRGSTRSIGEIILACGYTNPDTFRNAFKSRTGTTPRAFRATATSRRT